MLYFLNKVFFFRYIKTKAKTFFIILFISKNVSTLTCILLTIIFSIDIQKQNQLEIDYHRYLKNERQQHLKLVEEIKDFVSCYIFHKTSDYYSLHT